MTNKMREVDEKKILKMMDDKGYITDKRKTKTRTWLSICDNIIWETYYAGTIHYDDPDFDKAERECKKYAYAFAGRC